MHISPYGAITNTYASTSTLGTGWPAISSSTSVTTESLLQITAFASTYSVLSFQFAVISTAETPFELEEVPLVVGTAGWIERQGDSYTSGTVRVAGPQAALYGLDIDNNTTSLDSEFRFTYQPMIPWLAYLSVQCGSSAVILGTSTCDVFATTTIEFDQNSFDALYGSQAFSLSDYYVIELSPNAFATPVPGTIFLYGGALFVLGFWKRAHS
jgi:hypothetical protein